MSWRSSGAFWVVVAVVALLSGCGGKSRLQLGAAADGEVVEVVGESVLDHADKLATKQKSLVDAQKKAVEMVVGVHISAKTMVEKAVQIESKILARTDGYIKKYDVLKEWEEGSLYKTRIRALVSTQAIADDLKALGLLKEPQVGYPRVAVLLMESAKDAGSDLSAATNAVAQAFLDKGFRVVDRTDLMAAKAELVAGELAKGDVSNVGGLGKQLDAEVLIFGSAEAVALSAEGLGGLSSYRATLTAQAYKAQTNEILVTSAKTASGLDSVSHAAALKALGSAGKAAGEEMAGRLAEELRRRAFVAVTVTGVTDLGRLKELESAISMVPGVGDYYLRSLGAGRALIEVQLLSVSARDLAGSLEKSSGKAKAVSVTQDAVEIALQ